MEIAAFCALTILAIVRLPALKRGGAGALSELALLTGAGAMFMVGTAVPLVVVDGWLGGTNISNLLQNALATLAIWFMSLTAALMATGSVRVKRNAITLVAVIAVFTTLFFFIDRGPTDTDFVHHYGGNLWLWLYASVYMGYVAYLMARMFLALFRRDARLYAPVLVGAAGMAAASVVEIAYLTSRQFGLHPEALGNAFIPLFYGGILLLSAGLGWFPLARQTRNLSLAIANALLRRAGAAHLHPEAERAQGETLAHGTYRLAVQLADIGNGVELNRSEQWALRFATRLLDMQVPAPHVIRMSADPKAVV